MAKKQNLEEFYKKLKRWMRVMPDKVHRALSRGADLVIAHVQKEHLSGPKMPRGVGHPSRATLEVWTARLRRAITKRISVSKTRMKADIGGKLKYLRIHELGGVIRPRKAKMLRWKDETGWHMAKQVTIPARPFLRPSVRAKRQEVMVEILQGAIGSYRRA